MQASLSHPDANGRGGEVKVQVEGQRGSLLKQLVGFEPDQIFTPRLAASDIRAQQ